MSKLTIEEASLRCSIPLPALYVAVDRDLLRTGGDGKWD